MRLLLLKLRTFIRHFGYDIVRFFKLDGPYESINISSGYAPWKEEKEFDKFFLSIANNSLVTKYRCFEL